MQFRFLMPVLIMVLSLSQSPKANAAPRGIYSGALIVNSGERLVLSAGDELSYSEFPDGTYNLELTAEFRDAGGVSIDRYVLDFKVDGYRYELNDDFYFNGAILAEEIPRGSFITVKSFLNAAEGLDVDYTYSYRGQHLKLQGKISVISTRTTNETDRPCTAFKEKQECEMKGQVRFCRSVKFEVDGSQRVGSVVDQIKTSGGLRFIDLDRNIVVARAILNGFVEKDTGKTVETVCRPLEK